MIQVDLPMPEHCIECPMYEDSVFGKCNAKGIWFGEEEDIYFRQNRPVWCPLEEVSE